MNSINNLLNSEVIKEFETNGVVCLRNVLSNDEVNSLRHDIDSMMKPGNKSQTAYDFENLQKQYWSGADSLTNLGSDRFDLDFYKLILDSDEAARPMRENVDVNAGGKFFYEAGQWRFNDGIKNVAKYSLLPEASAKLLDSEYINFWEDNVFVKTPQTGQKTTFHQDWGNFQITGRKCCVIWIPLDKVTRDNGGMEYIRGSHLWDKTYAPNLLISQTADPTSPYEKMPDIEANIDKYDVISFDVNPGDVIIHHIMTVHGSGANTSRTKTRRAIALRYCGDDVRYFDKPGAIDQPYISHHLKNGDRLIADDYPLVWGQLPVLEPA